MSQTSQRNGILRRYAKGPRDMQNAARAAEKNATIVIDVIKNLRLTVIGFE